MVQLCAQKYAPAGYLDLMVCQHIRYREAAPRWEQRWEECAQQLHLPAGPIRNCLTGGQGKVLLIASLKHSVERARNLRQDLAPGVSILFIAGQPYGGCRTSASFLKAICDAYGGATPAACQSLPVPAAVNVTILFDERCRRCPPADRLESDLQTMVKNPIIKKLDYGETQGRALYESFGDHPPLLPVVLFDSSLEKDADAQDILRALVPLGKYLREFGCAGRWNPACAGECDAPECKDTLACHVQVAEKTTRM